MKDTSPKMEELHRRLIMSLAPIQRLRMACGMFETAKILAAAGIRADAARRGESVDMKRELFLRFYGSDFSEEKIRAILRALAPE
jgi:hypothetical protein